MKNGKAKGARGIGKDIALPLLLTAVALLLSYYFYTGPFVYYDDNFYLLFAHEMANGTYRPIRVPYSVELLTDASLALSFLLFGYGPLQAALPSLLEYLLTILFVFFLGKKMFGRYFAAIAALLFLTAPFVVNYTTRALPDILTGLTVAIAIYFLYDAIKANSKSGFFFSGFFAALTMLAKTAGGIMIILFLIILLYLSFDKKLGKRVKYAVFGLLVPLAAMLLFFFLTTHNPLYNLYVYANGFKGAASTLSENMQIFNILLNPVLLLKTASYTQQYPLGIAVFLAFIGSVIGIARKDKFLISNFLLFAVPLLYMFFGTMSLSKYAPMVVVSRYFEIVAAPIAILATYSLFELYNAVAKTDKLIAALTITILAVFAISTNMLICVETYSYDLYIRSYNMAYPFILHYLPPNTTTLIESVIPGLDVQYFEFLSSFSKTFLPLPPACTSSYNSMLLINSATNYDFLQQASLLSKWAGSNCTLQLVSEINISTGNSAYTKVELYRIKANK